ncbi:DUF401 family protein [Desulfotalea psychrophila]|uniref:Hypothetical membrane protein n=1 Tax=Desulfotalea psychrophila (strain LSv54 / DSM 12343) TaxID=177439 RepID=Q6AQT7_DESPS|nr:DUF401 family protein [Desulfotalea psychrophila]CAG35286.1 hypothetical membrane protein [Desulfotalea psychrophila LSv54]
MIVALLAAGLCVIIQNRLSPRFLLEMIGRKSVWAMLAVIASVFIFKDVMPDAGVVQDMAQAGGGFALFFAAVLLPFLVGAIAGTTFAFVGATFPLLLGLLHALGMDGQILAYLVLASFSGFTGVLISPLHICFLLTCEFFQASPSQTWRQLLIPCLCFFLTGIAVLAFLPL